MKTNKAQRLAIASHVAQSIRGAAPRTRERTIKVVNKDGEVVGTVTLAELQKVTLERAKIELETEVGVRPKEMLCPCGRAMVKVSKTGRLGALRCAGCYLCHECGGLLSRKVWAPHKVKARQGAPAVCNSCGTRKGMAAMTPEQRSKRALKMREEWAAMTPEQRSEATRKMRAALTPEQLQEAGRKGLAARRRKAEAEAST